MPRINPPPGPDVTHSMITGSLGCGPHTNSAGAYRMRNPGRDLRSEGSIVSEPKKPRELPRPLIPQSMLSKRGFNAANIFSGFYKRIPIVRTDWFARAGHARPTIPIGCHLDGGTRFAPGRPSARRAFVVPECWRFSVARCTAAKPSFIAPEFVESI